MASAWADGTRTNRADGWELAIGQPPVHRMEYLLELRYRDGGAEIVTDPGNPTSLGALAMLHAHCAAPDAFAGLFLQSGSFFTPRFDAHESWLTHYPRIVTFVAEVPDLLGRPMPTVLTCGVIEENLNRVCR